MLSSIPAKGPEKVGGPPMKSLNTLREELQQAEKALREENLEREMHHERELREAVSTVLVSTGAAVADPADEAITVRLADGSDATVVLKVLDVREPSAEQKGA